MVKARVQDAQAVANFLLAQDVRPAPREADIAEFLGRSGAELFCVLHQGEIDGVASYSLDGQAAQVVHLAMRTTPNIGLGAELIGEIESAARRGGAALLTAQTSRDSRACAVLLDYGFAIDWEEDDVVDGRIVRVVDLVKQL